MREGGWVGGDGRKGVRLCAHERGMYIEYGPLSKLLCSHIMHAPSTPAKPQ